MGIRGRLLIFAVVVAVPFAVLGFIGLRDSWNVSRAQLNDSIRQQAELAAVAFESWVDSQANQLAKAAATLGDQGFNDDLLRRDLRRLAARPHWLDVSVVSQNEKILAAEPPRREPLPAALIKYVLNETHRDKSWIVLTDRTQGEGLTLAIAAPIPNGGAIVARIDGVAIQHLFSEIQLRDQSVIAVFDSEGRILYRSQTAETPIDREVNSSALVSALGRQRTGIVEVESPYDGIRRLYGLARSSSSHSTAVVGIPSAALYEPARRHLMIYLSFSLLLFAATLLAGVLIARRITRPIIELQRATKAFGADELKARARIAKSGEIGELGAAFNRMADQIVEREERLKELDRLKSEFVSSVSHELRTPLTTIKTLTHVLLRRDSLTPEQREHLETIATECNRQIDLVNNLLDLSRIESGDYRAQLSRVNPAEVISTCRQIAQHAADARSQTLRTELARDVSDVRADPTSLRRVVCALIENAIKYTPDGGEIVVGARNENEEVAVYVTDTGRGISPSDLPHIFEKFYRGGVSSSPLAAQSSEQPGVGLGLYIARGLIQQLGGRIEAQSLVGEGSTFTIYLSPAAEHAGGEQEDKEHVEALTGN